MTRIDINTAHDITINTSLASTLERFLAELVDLLIIGVWALISTILIGASSFIYSFILLLVAGFYHFAFEIFNHGQSIGKKVLGLRVVTERGTTPTINAYFKRWTFRLIDVFGSLGSIGIIFIMSTSKKQRIGDIIAQTIVIKIKNQKFIDLNQLEEFYSTEKEILFPKVTRYNDQDMLLVKESIDRYKKYPNSKNRELIDELYYSISEELDIDQQKNSNQLRLLETVLEEYILLTR